MILGNHPIILITNSKTCFKLHPFFPPLRGPSADRMALGWPCRESKVHGMLLGRCKDCLKIALPSHFLDTREKDSLPKLLSTCIWKPNRCHKDAFWTLSPPNRMVLGWRTFAAKTQAWRNAQDDSRLMGGSFFFFYMFDHPRPPAWLGWFPSNLGWSS